MNDNVPAKFVTAVWPWYYDETALYYANSMLIVINYLSCLNPQFLWLPVSTIDYDNFFEIAVH